MKNLVTPPSSSWRWVAVAALCAAGAGCSGDDDDDDHSTTAIESVEDFVAQSNQGYCSKLRECCSADELAEHPLAAASVEDCAALLDGAATIFRASTDAGRAEYDPAMGGSCVETYASLSCDDPRLHGAGSLPSCENVLRGKVLLGDRCDQPYECVDGSCDFEMGGFCAPFKANGELCLTHRDCESNYCDPFAGCSDEPAVDQSICR